MDFEVEMIKAFNSIDDKWEVVSVKRDNKSVWIKTIQKPEVWVFPTSKNVWEINIPSTKDVERAFEKPMPAWVREAVEAAIKHVT